MEASAAGLAAAPAGGDAAAQQGQQQAQGEQAPANNESNVDIGALLNGLGQQLEETRTFLQSEPWRAAPDDGTAEAGAQQPTGELTVEDLSFLDETQPGYSQEAALKGLTELIDNRAAEKAQALVSPLADRLGGIESSRAMEGLVAEFPQMADPELTKQVVDHTAELAKQLGHPELAGDPGLIRITFLAGRALDASQREQAAGADGAAPLEGAGGASPGGAAQGTAVTAEQVTASWRGQRLPFMSGAGSS